MVNIPSKYKRTFKPKFTANDFVKDSKVVSKNIAKDFVRYVNTNYLNNATDDLKSKSKFLGAEKPLTRNDVLKAVKRKNNIVFIQKNVVVNSISVSELISILEYGRIDKGIVPNPEMRKLVKAYKPTYVRHVKTFLLK